MTGTLVLDRSRPFTKEPLWEDKYINNLIGSFAGRNGEQDSPAARPPGHSPPAAGVQGDAPTGGEERGGGV